MPEVTAEAAASPSCTDSKVGSDKKIVEDIKCNASDSDREQVDEKISSKALPLKSESMESGKSAESRESADKTNGSSSEKKNGESSCRQTNGHGSHAKSDEGGEKRKSEEGKSVSGDSRVVKTTASSVEGKSEEGKTTSDTGEGKSACESAGGSKGSGNIPDDISELINEGRICLLKCNFSGAADLLGTACEKMRELFGELNDLCGPVYYYYGWAMLECAKTEEDVLGEEVKKKEEEEQEAENESDSDGGGQDEVEAEGKDGEKAEGKDGEEAEGQDGEEAEGQDEEEEQGGDKMETDDQEESGVAQADGENQEEDEEEDTTLKAAWETLELAKIIFERQADKKMLADVYMKLGEVGVESGHQEGIDDMKQCLSLRSEVYPINHRAIPETHFNIGLSYSLFQLFDEAIDHFELSKDLLKRRIESLSASPEAEEEIKEIKELLPEIDDKIRDMRESKVEKRRAESTMKAVGNDESSGGSAAAAKTEASSLSTTLIKRKRKIDQVVSDLPEGGNSTKVAKQDA